MGRSMCFAHRLTRIWLATAVLFLTTAAIMGLSSSSPRRRQRKKSKQPLASPPPPPPRPDDALREGWDRLLLQNGRMGEPAKVINPMTGRLVTVGGDLYRSILQQRQWIRHNRTLVPLIDGNTNQQVEKEEEGITLKHEPFEPLNLEEWCVLTPHLLVQESPGDFSQQCQPLDILFVYKPSQLHCVPPRQPTTTPSSQKIVDLTTQIQEYFPTAKPCHRLDYDTSGILVYGLTPQSHSYISQQFQDRTIHKTYVALCHGHFSQDHGTIDIPIGKRWCEDDGGYHKWALQQLEEDDQDADNIINPRQATTDYKVLERRKQDDFSYTMVELYPRTGRGHQLRLHCQALGHAIVGDTLHGNTAVEACVSSSSSPPRLCLHAQKLELELDPSKCGGQVAGVENKVLFTEPYRILVESGSPF